MCVGVFPSVKRCERLLVGRVVKASASRAEDPGFESRLRRFFSGSSHTSLFVCLSVCLFLFAYLFVCLLACLLVGMYVCLSVCCSTSQQHASASQRRICSDNFTCCHTAMKLQIKLSTSPSHSILTPDKPVPALTL